MSLDDDQPPTPEPVSTPAHVLLARVDDSTRALFAEGQRETARRSYVHGSALRYAVNQVRFAAGLPPLWHETRSLLLATEDHPGPDGSVDVPLPGTDAS